MNGERPIRVQLSRKKGWRMPPNTVSVARPTIYGNQYRIGQDGTREECVAKFRADAEDALNGPVGLRKAVWLAMLRNLRGKNVACWCGLNDPCHGDVWLELANQGQHQGD